MASPRAKGLNTLFYKLGIQIFTFYICNLKINTARHISIQSLQKACPHCSWIGILKVSKHIGHVDSG
jgi:hypothetical protein